MGLGFPTYPGDVADGDERSHSPNKTTPSLLGTERDTNFTRRLETDTARNLYVRVANQPPFLFSPAGNLLVENVSSRRLIWNTDVDWNKGILGSDVEVFGSGIPAVIRPNSYEIPASFIYLTWNFNESAGPTVADSSQYGRTGTLVTPEPYQPAQFVAGKINNAISNPGELEAADYVDGGNIGGFEWSDPFSIDCWVNLAAGYEFLSLVDKYDNILTKGWVVQIQSNYLSFFMFGNSVENFIQVYGPYIPSNEYHHLVITYDGSGVAAGVTMYIDGVLAATSVYWDGLGEVSILNPASLCIGAAPNRGVGFIGQIDAFNIYTKALTQADVDFRYNAGAGTETALEYSEAYKTTAHYETNIFDSGVVDQLWELFDAGLVLPSGTAIVIKARVSNDSSSMGSYGSALTVGESLGLNGRFIQFSVDFTGTIDARALADYISVRYMAIPVQDIAP